jgi:hypothetical protein
MLKLILLLSLAFVAILAKPQNIEVTGNIFCGIKSLEGQKIELREHDTLDPDDSLATAISGKQGIFKLNGTDDEMTSIAPYVRIVHNCDVSDKKCKRTSDYYVPKKDIATGKYDYGVLNLNTRGQDDKEKC